jgi:hypothetical protein
LAVALAIAALAPPPRLAAHEIPANVTVQTFFRPEGQTLRVLVRVPLEAMRDMDYPKRGRDLVDLSRLDPVLHDASTLWVGDELEVYEGDTRLPYPEVAEVRASLPSDTSFQSYDTALAHLTGPKLPNDTEFIWNQGLLDILLEYPIQSDRSKFSIRPKLARLGLTTVTVLRFLPPGGAERAFEFQGDPGLVRLDPSWRQAAFRFVQMGFGHILEGIDHLLFLFCLVIPFRRLRSLIPIVTSFTVAHSITLIASAYDMAPQALWFPPLVETLIAMSIVYMALENIVAAQLRRRWIITFAFGLVHGFGFSFGLRQTLQFAGSHLLTSLLAFNVGVELGQVFVLVLLVPALEFFFRHGVAERLGTIVLSALVAHTGWHWMIERGTQLAQYNLEWPELTPAFLLLMTRWAMVLVVIAAIAWFVFGVLRQPTRRPAVK